MPENELGVIERLKRFVKDIFKTNLEIFFEALKLSPNAQGYVGGSITELLLKRKMENEYGLEVKRIREKWEGRKHLNHHGDFYFRKPADGLWYVLESKGVKSNSEKFHKLYNGDSLKRFLIAQMDKINWLNDQPDEKAKIEKIARWIEDNLPKFSNEYKEDVYPYNEVKEYFAKNHASTDDEKYKRMQELEELGRDKIDDEIFERLKYLRTKIGVLETHFVATKTKTDEEQKKAAKRSKQINDIPKFVRKQATPRKDEFNLIAVDIYLRYIEHKFYYADPQCLADSVRGASAPLKRPSKRSSCHLRQNYIMGFVFFDERNRPILKTTTEWTEDFEKLYEDLPAKECISEDDWQPDERKERQFGIDE